MDITKVEFNVDAGKYDGDERNYKYCHSFDNAGAALEAFKSVQDYHWYDFYVSTYYTNHTGIERRTDNYLDHERTDHFVMVDGFWQPDV